MKNSKVYRISLFSGVLLCAIAMLSGCSSKTKHSGFLVDYSGLKESDEYKVDLRYINPQKDLSQYDKFILEPVRVHFAPAAKGTAIDPDKLKNLSDFFKTELVKGLSENYTIVEQPGQGVSRVVRNVVVVDALDHENARLVGGASDLDRVAVDEPRVILGVLRVETHLEDG